MHREDASITWCGLPTDWEPYEGQDKNSKKQCTYCKNKDEEFVTERAKLKAMQLRAGKAGW